jgi:site-specific recombinase XerC
MRALVLIKSVIDIKTAAMIDSTPPQGSLATLPERRLSRAEFQGLGEMPPELEWFANLDNPRTRRAYRIDVKEFTAFAGVERPEEMRQITRAHLIAWRKDLERRGQAPSSIRRKLAAVASLFDHLCEVNAVAHNPVRGVKRPKAETNEGKTPALGDGQARALLEAPPVDTLKGKRDRAILATFLHHGLRCEELCGLRVRDLQTRQGVIHLRIFGKGSKIRYVPAHPLALQRIDDYLESAGHSGDPDRPLFQPIKNPTGQGNTDRPLTHGAIYHCVLRKYAKAVSIDLGSFGRTPCVLRPPPTRWTAAPIWAKSRSGSVMPTFRPPVSTTAARAARRTVPLSASRTERQFQGAPIALVIKLGLDLHARCARSQIQKSNRRLWIAHFGMASGNKFCRE